MVGGYCMHIIIAIIEIEIETKGVQVVDTSYY